MSVTFVLCNISEASDENMERRGVYIVIAR